MINTQILDLPEVHVIGREGLCTAENNMVAQLWEEANAHFNEIAHLVRKDAQGIPVGFWGAMSDVSRSFKPWDDGFSRGLYLAGAEVMTDAETPEGWTKWIMPARRYLVAQVEPNRYNQIFFTVINITLPSMGLTLSGAVCDFTEPSTGKNKLFFPVLNL